MKLEELNRKAVVYQITNYLFKYPNEIPFYDGICYCPQDDLVWFSETPNWNPKEVLFIPVEVLDIKNYKDKVTALLDIVEGFFDNWEQERGL